MRRRAMGKELFEILEKINTRPEPFAFYTASDLWTDPFTSRKMLSFHLNDDLDLSSRNTKFIDRSVDWIASRFHVGTGTKIADFGCGPGLYANRLARRHADVTGIDFSERSIRHARMAAAKDGLTVRYVHQNYLAYDTDDRFDLVLMIMCDYCALSPAQRKKMLETFSKLLVPGGAVLLDVYSVKVFDRRNEAAVYEANLLDGFWSPENYYGFLNTFKYEKEKVVLDQFTIVEADRTRTVYNWLQYFSPRALEQEFEASGLHVAEFYADVAGSPFDPESTEFAVVVRKA